MEGTAKRTLYNKRDPYGIMDKSGSHNFRSPPGATLADKPYGGCLL